MDKTDKIGNRYGKLTVLSIGKTDEGRQFYLCKCDCGKEKEIARNRLTHKTKSCGCVRKQNGIRAGKRKCSRCKEVFNKPKGMITLCTRCTSRCVRCDVVLTENNKSSKRIGKRCKRCSAEVSNKHRKNNSFKVRDQALIRTYGITATEYENMFIDQGGVCWICKTPPKNNRLSVDHKHEKGERKKDPRLKRPRVRGLLCWKCNPALGKFRDNPEYLRRAADYLEQMPAQRILTRKQNET